VHSSSDCDCDEDGDTTASVNYLDRTGQLTRIRSDS
jgi:hypothetical protein